MEMKMDQVKYLFLFTFLTPIMAETIYCDGGSKICSGRAPYCCMLDYGEEGCCWDTFVYEMWWFWLVWVGVFFMLLACSLACWRRRQRHRRYVVMSNSEYPTYGTVTSSGAVISTGTVVTPYGYGQVGPNGTLIASAATAPVAPPSYASKPPPYSG